MTTDRLDIILKSFSKDDLKTVLVTGLKKKEKDIDGKSRGALVDLLSSELRKAAQHDIFEKIKFREKFPYKKILIDVADKMSPGITPFSWTDYTLNDKHKEKEIEERILEYFDESVKNWWKKMGEKDKNEFIQSTKRIFDKIVVEDVVLDQMKKEENIKKLVERMIESGVSYALLNTGATGAVLGFLGASLATEIGFIIVVQTLGWWAGIKGLIFGVGVFSLSQIGVAVVTGPLIVVSSGLLFTNTNYRKTIPSTILILSIYKKNRRQLTAKK